jgi:hypothetical protein
MIHLEGEGTDRESPHGGQTQTPQGGDPMSAVQSEPLQSATTRRKLGVVVSFHQERGSLTLRHRDGTRSDLFADPILLGDLRIGSIVQVQVEGPVIRNLRRL